MYLLFMTITGSLTRLTGRLLILSGKTGEVLQWVETPDGKESYYSPQILTGSDGADYVLFGTGGETHGGGLYVITLSDLYNGVIKNVIPSFTWQTFPYQ